MAVVDHVFKDANLTQPFDDAVDKLSAFALSGDSGDGGPLYIGIPDASATPTRKLQENADPGINNLVFDIIDDNPGVEVEAADIQLALTQGGLDSAVPGDPLSLGATINSKPENAVAVYWRITNNVGSGTFTGFGIRLSARVESDI